MKKNQWAAGGRTGVLLVVTAAAIGWMSQPALSASSSAQDHRDASSARRLGLCNKCRGMQIESAASRLARWKAVPSTHKRTPYVNSPEWLQEQAEAERKDRDLDRKIRSICCGC